MKAFYILVLFGLLTVVGFGQTRNNCSCVDAANQPQTIGREWCQSPNLSDAETVEIMSCLLKFKGNRTPIWGNVLSNKISQTFGPSPLEVVALFQISRLFYQNENFADAMVLRDDRDRLNSNGNIKKAYRSYTKWLKQVNQIGLAEMRKRQIDPLKTSGLSWYGNVEFTAPLTR